MCNNSVPYVYEGIIPAHVTLDFVSHLPPNSLSIIAFLVSSLVSKRMFIVTTGSCPLESPLAVSSVCQPTETH